MKIEIEVDSLDQLDEALAEGADVVLLDNMTPSATARSRGAASPAARCWRPPAASPRHAPAIAETGVDVICVGALTPRRAVLDIGLDWRRGSAGAGRRPPETAYLVPEGSVP